jgi:hypothetical protein
MIVGFCIPFMWIVTMETIKNLETLEDNEDLHSISQIFFTMENKQKYNLSKVKWEQIQKEQKILKELFFYSCKLNDKEKNLHTYCYNDGNQSICWSYKLDGKD